MHYIYIFLLWCISSCIRIRCTQSTTRWWWCCIPTVEIPTVHVIWEHTPALLAVVVVLYLWFGSLPHEASSHWRKRCVNARKEFLVPFFFFFFTPFNWHRHRFDIRCIVRMGHCVQVLLAGHLPNFLECIWRAALDRPQSSVGCCACIHRQSKQTYWLPHATATVDSNFILQAFQPAANRNGTWIVEWTDDDSRVEGGEYPSWLPLQMHSNSYCLSRSWTIHYQTDTHTLDTYTQSTCNMFNTRSFAFLACRLLCADRRKLDIFGEFFCRTTNITLTAGWWLITLLAMCCAGLSMQQSVWLEHKLPTMQHDNDI